MYSNNDEKKFDLKETRIVYNMYDMSQYIFR